jgi:hypothetical protein
MLCLISGEPTHEHKDKGSRKFKSFAARRTTSKRPCKHPLVYHYVFLTTGSKERSLQSSQWVRKHEELWRLNDLPGAATQYGARLRLELPSAFAPGFCSTLSEPEFSKTRSFSFGVWHQDYGKLYQEWRNSDSEQHIRGHLTPGLKASLCLILEHWKLKSNGFS